MHLKGYQLECIIPNTYFLVHQNDFAVTLVVFNLTINKQIF